MLVREAIDHGWDIAIFEEAEPRIMGGPKADRQGFGGLSPSRGGGGEEEPPGGPEADRQGFGGLSQSHLRTCHLRRPGASG